MLTVHHLGKSQSERIVWLCEELAIPYELKLYERDRVTLLAPPEYKALHPTQAAPVIFDGDLVLAESGAIMEYIIAKYGRGRFTVPADHPDYPQYLYWFHAANGTILPSLGRNMLMGMLNLTADNPRVAALRARLERQLQGVTGAEAQVVIDVEPSVGYDLARVEKVMRIEGRFDLGHDLEQALPDLLGHELGSSNPDAVLSRQRAVELLDQR